MKYNVGDVIWIKADIGGRKKVPIKIIDEKWYESRDEFIYTFVNARDDAALDGGGNKYNYYDTEEGIDKLSPL